MKPNGPGSTASELTRQGIVQVVQRITRATPRRGSGGSAAAGAGSAPRRGGRAFFFEDSAAVFAEDQEPARLIPWLYLKGVSTGDFSEALQALVGPQAAGLSASTVTRLKQVWEQEYDDWSKRSLEGKEFVYLWADGIHFNVRLEEDRQCILVLMGARADGHKELIALADGYRESEQSWLTLLVEVKQRGLRLDPKLATGDGAPGILEGLDAGVFHHQGTALLGPQDG